VPLLTYTVNVAVYNSSAGVVADNRLRIRTSFAAQDRKEGNRIQKIPAAIT